MYKNRRCPLGAAAEPLPWPFGPHATGYKYKMTNKPSVQVLSQAMNDLYLDSYLIPKPPENFHCSACSEAAATAVYIKKRSPHSALPQTPYEALKGEKPSIKHLQPFSRKCYVHIPEEARPSGSKLLPRAIEGRFLGYEKSDKIYRIPLYL